MSPPDRDGLPGEVEADPPPPAPCPALISGSPGPGRRRMVAGAGVEHGAAPACPGGCRGAAVGTGYSLRRPARRRGPGPSQGLRGRPGDPLTSVRPAAAGAAHPHARVSAASGVALGPRRPTFQPGTSNLPSVGFRVRHERIRGGRLDLAAPAPHHAAGAAPIVRGGHKRHPPGPSRLRSCEGLTTMEGELSRRTLEAAGAVDTMGELAPERAASRPGPGSAAREDRCP
jgi:hypothetical protein